MQNASCSRRPRVGSRAQNRCKSTHCFVLGVCTLMAAGACSAAEVAEPTLPPIETDLPSPIGTAYIADEWVWHAGSSVLYYINPTSPYPTSRLSALDFRTNESQELAKPVYCCPRLSVDGSVLFYRGETLGERPVTIYRLATESGSGERVANSYESTYAISPDGTLLAWKDHDSSVSVRNFTTGNVQTFLSDGEPISISPDHSRMALYLGAGSIEVLSLPTGTITRYTFDPETSIAGTRWSPVGPTFLLLSAKGILRFTPTNGPPHTIWATTNMGPHNGYIPQAASWSPDGRRIVAVVRRIYEARMPTYCHCQSRLLLIDLDTGGEERLASAWHIWAPQYAEDGRSVMFAANSDAAYRVPVP